MLMPSFTLFGQCRRHREKSLQIYSEAKAFNRTPRATAGTEHESLVTFLELESENGMR